MSHPAFMFVAGDPSGDQNTAPVIRYLHKEIPDCECYGIGGPMMQAEGFTSFLPFEEFNRMGYVEVLSHLSFFLRAKKLIVRKMKELQPALLVCVDYSGFNTPVMKAAHALGIPVLWYIAPKVWAWKKKKHTTNLKKYATHIAAIFPFEVDVFRPYIPAVTFVGNPLVEFINSKNYPLFTVKTEDLRKKEHIQLALVPGSRMHELQNILPVMIAAFRLLKQKYPNLSATVSTCGHIAPDIYKTIIDTAAVDLFDGPLEEMFSHSDLALVTSGTATLQTALMGVPMIIMYKTSFITYLICKTFTTGIDHIGLPNIIAGEEVVPECIQGEMTPEALVPILQKYIESPSAYQSVVKKLVSLKENLGIRKPSEEVTKLIKKISGLDEQVS